MPTIRMLEGKLYLKEDVTDLCFTSAPTFIKTLMKVFGLQFPVSNNENFVIYGFQVPNEDQKDKLWIRTDRAGHFQGYFLFIEGRWQRIYDHSIQDVVWKSGDSQVLEEGFQLIDGTVASIPVDVQTHIMSYYHIDAAQSTPLNTVYDYFAVIYLGI